MFTKPDAPTELIPTMAGPPLPRPRRTGRWVAAGTAILLAGVSVTLLATRPRPVPHPVGGAGLAWPGLAGTALGLLATVAYAAGQDWPVVVPAPSAAAGVGGAIIIGVLAGVYPCVRAARLSPTQALAG